MNESNMRQILLAQNHIVKAFVKTLHAMQPELEREFRLDDAGINLAIAKGFALAAAGAVAQFANIPPEPARNIDYRFQELIHTIIVDWQNGKNP